MNRNDDWDERSSTGRARGAGQRTPSPALRSGGSDLRAEALEFASDPMRLLVAIGVPVLLVIFTTLIDAVVVPEMINGGGWFDAGRPDFFLMADAFLHGRLWLAVDWRSPINDIIVLNGHVYVPFAPFPAFFFMPLVALIGVGQAIAWEPRCRPLRPGSDPSSSASW